MAMLVLFFGCGEGALDQANMPTYQSSLDQDDSEAGSDDLKAASGTSSDSRNPLSLSDAYKIAATDLLKQSNKSSMRYLSLVHLYNSGVSDADLEATRQGISKVFNSLSRSSKISVPVVIDSRQTILRVNIKDYKWDADKWSTLVKSYIYLVVPKDSQGLAVLQKETDSSVPMINADWFISKAPSAPLYYDLLDLKKNLKDFQKDFDLDINKNIAEGRVMRAGFNDSSVSVQNRVIERHSIKNGYLWRSYEFATSKGNQDVLKNPLGPSAKNGNDSLLGGLLANNPALQAAGGLGNNPALQALGNQGLGNSGNEDHAFIDDGGEFIFSLPNGMLGFYIVGKDDQRIDEAPTDEDEEPIVAGRSCMKCHARGFVKKDDMVFKASQSAGLDSEEMALVEKLYGSGDLDKTYESDSQDYLKALKKAQVDADQKDPVVRIFGRFNLKLDQSRMAAELGISEDELEDLGFDQTMSRSKFEKEFAEAAEEAH
jgi:hypothetical protein